LIPALCYRIINMLEPVRLMHLSLRQTLLACLAAAAASLSGCALTDEPVEPVAVIQEPVEEFVGPPEARPFGMYIARTAASQIGTPYRLGGQTPGKSFDCSGLVQWAYSQYGISVPRQSTGQRRVGKSISLSEAMAGDLIIFKSSSAVHGLHTGIMTSRRTFVHAPRQGFKIREESVNSYWRRHLLSIRRVSDFSLVMTAEEVDELIDRAQSSQVAIKPLPRPKKVAEAAEAPSDVSVTIVAETPSHRLEPHAKAPEAADQISATPADAAAMLAQPMPIKTQGESVMTAAAAPIVQPEGSSPKADPAHQPAAPAAAKAHGTGSRNSVTPKASSRKAGPAKTASASKAKAGTKVKAGSKAKPSAARHSAAKATKPEPPKAARKEENAASAAGSASQKTH